MDLNKAKFTFLDAESKITITDPGVRYAFYKKNKKVLNGDKDHYPLDTASPAVPGVEIEFTTAGKLVIHDADLITELSETSKYVIHVEKIAWKEAQAAGVAIPMADRGDDPMQNTMCPCTGP